MYPKIFVATLIHFIKIRKRNTLGYLCKKRFSLGQYPAKIKMLISKINPLPKIITRARRFSDEIRRASPYQITDLKPNWLFHCVHYLTSIFMIKYLISVITAMRFGIL